MSKETMAARRTSRRPSQALKEGFLTKQGHVVRNWKLRWFVLREDGNFEYFAQPNDRTPKGRVRIDKSWRVEPVETTPGLIPNLFRLSGKKNFMLSAQTADSKMSWIHAIESTTGQASSPSSSSSSSSSSSLPSSTSASSSSSSSHLAPPSLSDASKFNTARVPAAKPVPTRWASASFIDRGTAQQRSNSIGRLGARKAEALAKKDVSQAEATLPSADAAAIATPPEPTAETAVVKPPSTQPEDSTKPEEQQQQLQTEKPTEQQGTADDALITPSGVLPLGTLISDPPAKNKEPATASTSVPAMTATSAGSRPLARVAEYQLGELLGKGQFGSVYRGLSVITGDMVAIKQLSLSNLSQKDMGSIIKEASLLSALKHENIVNLVQCVRTADTLNFVMEFVEGGSLLDLLKKFGGLPETLVRRYISQTLHGLAFLHEKGVVHRDIKAANLLITKAGQIKLADFGIAVVDGEAGTAEHNFAGSPYWLAPEVILLETPTSASDIWSLGCMIVELLTGSPPYFHMNPMSAMHAMADDARPIQIPPCSGELADFLRSCFKFNAKERASALLLLQHPFITQNPGASLSSASQPVVFTVDSQQPILQQAESAEAQREPVEQAVASAQTVGDDNYDDGDGEEEGGEREEEEEHCDDHLRPLISGLDELCSWLNRAIDRKREKEARQLYEPLLVRAKPFIKGVKASKDTKAIAFKIELVKTLDRFNREIEGAVEGFGQYESQDDESESEYSEDGSTETFDSDEDEDFSVIPSVVV